MIPTTDSPRTARRRFRLQRRAGLLALALLSACLVTDPLEEQIPVEIPGNQPPRIVESSVTPRNGALLDGEALADEACGATFTVGQVEERDVGAELSARWFVDGAWAYAQTLPATAEMRRDGPVYRLDISRLEPTTHVVLVVISDGFADGDDPQLARDGCFAVSYEWALDTANVPRCTPET